METQEEEAHVTTSQNISSRTMTSLQQTQIIRYQTMKRRSPPPKQRFWWCVGYDKEEGDGFIDFKPVVNSNRYWSA
jgi:hypothetical protein